MKRFINKQKVSALAMIAGLTGASAGANAALPDWFNTTFTAAETDILAAVAIIGPIIVGVAVAWLIPRLGKKGVNKLA